MTRKIGFVLASHSARALSSTRISVVNMLPYLSDAGWEAKIWHEPDSPTETPRVKGLAARMVSGGVDVAYFQKVYGESVLSEVRELSSAGVRTVFGVCDRVENDMAATCDATITVTDYLRGLYAPELQHKIVVVHDGVERPEIEKRDFRGGDRRDGRLRAVLVTGGVLHELPVIGRPPAFLDLRVVGWYPNAGRPLGNLRDAYWLLRRQGASEQARKACRWLVGRPFRKVHWGPESVYRDMLDADVGVIPVDPEPGPSPGLPVASWRTKSENRLTMKMALGLPVVASPVPAYMPVIRQGDNGYIATSREEWLEILEELRDAGRREAIGTSARASVLPRYSKEEQARRLLESLDRVVRDRGPAE